jgi:hypothetical protein
MGIKVALLIQTGVVEFSHGQRRLDPPPPKVVLLMGRFSVGIFLSAAFRCFAIHRPTMSNHGGVNPEVTVRGRETCESCCLDECGIAEDGPTLLP